MNALVNKIAEWVVLVGALNWGFKLFNFNLVQWVASTMRWSLLMEILYASIGVSAVYLIYTKFKR